MVAPRPEPSPRGPRLDAAFITPSFVIWLHCVCRLRWFRGAYPADCEDLRTAAADLQCRGILAIAEAYDDAVAAAGAVGGQLMSSRGPVTGLTSSQSVLLVTGSPPPNGRGQSRPGSNGIQARLLTLNMARLMLVSPCNVTRSG